jgi:hypothetical protein
VLAGFLIAAAVIGFIADVLSLWPRIEAFFKKTSVLEFMEMLRGSEPITLGIARPVFKKIGSRCTKSKNETPRLYFIDSNVLLQWMHPDADHLGPLAFLKKI